MLINVSELLLVVANSTADAYAKEVSDNLTLDERLILIQMFQDLLKVVNVIESVPPIIVEVSGDESFIYGK